MTRTERVRNRFEIYQDNPVAFIERELFGYVWSKQREICLSVVENRYTAVKACHGPGKALAADEPILTPTGWRTIDSLVVGDTVVAGDGRATKVIGVFPQGIRPLYRVTFNDGSSVLADAEHRWQTSTRAERRAGKTGGVRTTAEIAASLTFSNGRARGLNHEIPTVRAVEAYPHQEHDVDAYVMGQWLGDGDTSGRICGAPDQMAELERVVDLRPQRYNSPGSTIVAVPGLRSALRGLGLLGARSYEKWIPAIYLRADRAQREALLQGLMDTDGTVADNSLTFDTTSARLADDMAELCRSFGGLVRRHWRIPKIGDVEHRLCHRLTINLPPTVKPFRLRRKLALYQQSAHANAERGRRRFIQSVEPAGEGEAVCIAVDHPSQTFVTRDHIVTHNTAIAARIGAWWLSCYPPGDALLVSTAPTGHQVRALLWREINKVHRAGNLPGRCNQTEWIMPPNEIVGFGVAVRDTDPTRFQGIHAPRVLVILDEACGVTRSISEAAETLVTNDDSRLLKIGNPDDPSTAFADDCKPGTAYNVITISAYDTPNFTGEEVPAWMRKVLVSKTWVEERRKKWGETSPMYISKVLGEFPDISTDGLIPLGALQEAVNRDIPENVSFPNELGVDVARFGDDKSTFYHRVGPVARRVSEHRKRDTMELVGKVVRLAKMLKVDAIKIDDTGLGGGVTDRLNELRFEGKLKAKVVPVIVGQSATDDDAQERFYRLRDQLMWGMRERFIAGNIVLLPAVDLLATGETPVEDGTNELLAQAGSIKYKQMSTGQIVVESKADMKKRGLPSPDDFDGLTLAFAPSEIGGDLVLPFSSIEVTEKPAPIPQFWSQVCVIHIDEHNFVALWAAYHQGKDTLHLVDEYVAPLGEIAVHIEAVRRKSGFTVPCVFALKTNNRPKRAGVDLAHRMGNLSLPLLAVEEAPLEQAIPEIQARMQTGRLLVHETLHHWLAELQRFRKDSDGEILDGRIPLMHATGLLILSALQAAQSEAEVESDEDAKERDARSFAEDHGETGY